MSQIILDFGSGNTCKNNKEYIDKMLLELYRIDNGKHEIIIKWQLFERAGNNIPLDRNLFNYAYKTAKQFGYKTTSSVFDINSLEFLLKFDIPFVKIANNRKLDYLIEGIPRRTPVYVSISRNYKINDSRLLYDNEDNYIKLACVSKYPSKLEDYENAFIQQQLREHISDHTTNFDLFNKYKPQIIEWHYKLEDSTGLDSGPFARTPEQLKEVL